jgi:hypothetical protein
VWLFNYSENQYNKSLLMKDLILFNVIMLMLRQ